MDLKETIRILELTNKIKRSETINHHDLHEVQYRTEIAIDSAIVILKQKLEHEENIEKQLEVFNKLPATLVFEEPKITLRDHFAGLAMQALFTQNDFRSHSYFTHAGEAYKIADEMVKLSRLK